MAFSAFCELFHSIYKASKSIRFFSNYFNYVTKLKSRLLECDKLTTIVVPFELQHCYLEYTLSRIILIRVLIFVHFDNIVGTK